MFRPGCFEEDDRNYHPRPETERLLILLPMSDVCKQASKQKVVKTKG